ncbi:hypothetical protein ORI20_26585 [Mycobacterium sp. CVI_P3]|uniref:Integrase n=1 Tax=Mycobacterium pinniadriaticum TaxID=2994102 RepID=A0ABT3SMB3_9MYCO|nr:hypothetical protein [Mycobacterium pinniadriaticum]MCX2940303.1 hypothetical protein [Mycobacterium pinniadriaticum]
MGGGGLGILIECAFHIATVAVIAAWIGHKDATLTMRLYAHSQDDALKLAGAVLDRPFDASRDNG